MKLYLSSFRLGDHPERLVGLLPASPQVAVICNAIDAEDPGVRAEKVAAELAWLTGLGIAAEELDLRTLAATPEATGEPAPGELYLRSLVATGGGTGKPALGELDGYDGL